MMAPVVARAPTPFAGRHPGRASGWCVALAFTLASCQGGVLDPQGPIGAADRTLLIDSLAIMLAIAVPTIVATLAFAWWFRASNARARHLPDWDFSGSVELVVWSIPTMTII